MPDTIMAAPVALPMQLRRAPILPATVNTEARSVDVVFTTGAAVRRRRWTGWDTSVPFDEILEVSDRAVDLTRLNAGAPALDSHSVWSSHSQVGVVERAWIEGKEGKATIRFPREGLDQAADRMFGLISDGIIRNVSVGYSIERVKVVEPATKGQVEQRIVERWTPLEVSFVTVPADPRAQVRAADQASYPVEIVDTRMQKEASMPESTTTVAGDVPASTETRQPPVAASANPEPTAARMPDAPATPDSEAIATRAREAERDRVSTIYDLTGRVVGALPGAQLFAPEKFAAEAQAAAPGNAHGYGSKTGEQLDELFATHDAIVAVLSLGATVRMIAPFLQSKETDPAVVVLDEGGKFVIPVLSGHLGGANALAGHLATALGAQAVLTTASDSRETIAVDLLGRELGWTFEATHDELVRASAAVVNDDPVALVQEAGSTDWWTRHANGRQGRHDGEDGRAHVRQAAGKGGRCELLHGLFRVRSR